MSFTLSSGSLDTGAGQRGFSLPTLQLGNERFEAAEIFRRQPQVQTVVGFLARNVAQLGLHAFRRVSDTDRERLSDHPLAELLRRPLPGKRLTPYQLKYRLVADMAIYDTAFVLKVRPDGGPMGLLPVPVPLVTPVEESWIEAPAYKLAVGGQTIEVAGEDMIHIHGYSPDDLTVGESPLMALRDVLLEEYQATKHRQSMWKNGARVSGIIERPPPKGARDWSEEARTRFIREFRDLYSGDGAHAGGVPILEDGMTYKQAGLDPRAAQYIEARKLTREEVAAAYFIPPPLVGILDHATFSNIREQHKQLYQDTLGPWLTQIDEALETQLVSEFPDAEGLYLEFNLDEKMRGSFEEQAAMASTATGAPWMTVNEIRARNNLPSLEGGDELVTPLNVTQGGQASPRDSAPDPAERDDERPEGVESGKSRQVQVKAGAPEISVESAEESLSQFFARMGRSLSSQLGAAKSRGTKALEDVNWSRWESEIVPVLLGVNTPTSERASREALRTMGMDPNRYDAADMASWLEENAAAQARATTDTSRLQVSEALDGDEPSAALRTLFAWWAGDRAASIGRRQATHVSGHATVVQARKHLVRPMKTWVVTSGDPRDTHAALNGTSVAVDDVFPNGARWPGDSVLPAEEAAQCRCEITITGGEPEGAS